MSPRITLRHTVVSPANKGTVIMYMCVFLWLDVCVCICVYVHE